MAKKKVAIKKVAKPRAPRKKKVAIPSLQESVSLQPAMPPVQQQPPQVIYAPPYPLPIPTAPVSDGDDVICIDDVKKLWKTKTFWAAVCLFLLSMASIVFGLPQFANNPVVIGAGGMVIAVLWVVLRMATNNPVTPSINFPHPNEWFKHKPPV
jgi:hypothetical protein